MADVIQGLDGYLFLGNDTNRTTEQFEGRYPLEDGVLQTISRRHAERAGLMAARGGDYVHMLVPNKETVLMHLLPQPYGFQRHGLTPFNRYDDLGLALGYKSIFRPHHLRRKHEEQAAYARLDTHWTHFGAHAYLRECFRRTHLRNELRALDALPMASKPDVQRGDLGVKIAAADEPILYCSPAFPHAVTVLDNGVDNDGHVRFCTNREAPVRKRALVQHDSTGNWLHLVLRELFAETVFIHHANCDFDFIDRLAPDLFLFIQVERFFVREPANSVDLPTLIAGYEAKRGAPRSAVPFLASPPGKAA